MVVKRSGSGNRPDDENRTEEQVAAAAGPELPPAPLPVRKSVFRPKIKDDSLILNSKETGEIQTGIHREPGGWMFPPANYGMNVLGYGRLVEVTNLLGAPATEVKYVRAAHKPGTKFIYIWPTDSDDADKIELSEYNGLVFANLLDVVVKANLRVPRGVKRFFAAGFAGQDDPVEPALKVDLGRIIEEVAIPVTTKKGATAKSKPNPDGNHASDSNPAPSGEGI
jgi:hypothetical protein